MGQPLHLRGCLLLAAASYGAAPDARARPAVRRVSFSTMADTMAAAHCACSSRSAGIDAASALLITLHFMAQMMAALYKARVLGVAPPRPTRRACRLGQYSSRR